ncbi:SDR family oxidoreductase [Haloplanus rubicundus]|uniref:SDR family NAD(P)-dependent oxidoreductase n=1 Tax=Haloplanus rubicundus TaxID=1547898 RepID=A0A345EDW2_9EURY|nr:SDR family oxidoreductase [Haloplanus rubicundus]AXG10384.1 SDR family NAD(P)-dependent oxidoreductase [Haloplanus rubicundus]
MTYQRPDLRGRTAFVTGTTRGIGKEIALALAEAGCNVVSTGKTVDDSDTDLEGTIHETAAACEDRGVDAHAIRLDVRDTAAVRAAVDEAIETFGEVDVVVNNASAIQQAAIEDLPADRFDLLTEVNVRGTYLVSRAFLPHLRAIGGGHILTNAPPIRMDRAPGKAAYAWSKLGMTFATLSLAAELDDEPIAANAFWPVTLIETRATRYFGLGDADDWRTPAVVADTVLELLDRDPGTFSGHAVYDEDVLRAAGIEDFGRYNVTAGDPEPKAARMFDPEYERP